MKRNPTKPADPTTQAAAELVEDAVRRVEAKFGKPVDEVRRDAAEAFAKMNPGEPTDGVVTDPVALELRWGRKFAEWRADKAERERVSMLERLERAEAQLLNALAQKAEPKPPTEVTQEQLSNLVKYYGGELSVDTIQRNERGKKTMIPPTMRDTIAARRSKPTATYWANEFAAWQRERKREQVSFNEALREHNEATWRR